MTTSAGHKVNSFLDWLPKQKSPITHDALLAQGSAHASIPRETLSKLVTLLLTGDYLHMGEDLEHMPRYSVDRPRLNSMPEAKLEQLIRICSEETIAIPANHRGPGAPRGNTNALRHGAYSAKVHSLLTISPNYSLDFELAVAQAITTDLLDNPDAPVELILKALSTTARLKVAAASMATHLPPALPPPRDQEPQP
jgi:hypothetical protein